MPFRLQLPDGLYQAMLAQASAELPNECCGFLAGHLVGGAGRVTRRFPLVNAAASPREYFAEERGLFVVHRTLREEGLDHLAIYHSHPTSDPVPSRTDRERCWYPDVVHLIISLKEGTPRVRGWWLSEEDFREAEWECVPEEVR